MDMIILLLALNSIAAEKEKPKLNSNSIGITDISVIEGVSPNGKKGNKAKNSIGINDISVIEKAKPAQQPLNK